MGDNAERTAIQKKTFTRWCNTHLWDRQLKIEDLEKDLADGVLLIHLLEIISNKTIDKWNKKPKMNIQKLENLNKALDFIKHEGLKLVNIGSQDIHNCNLKIILGLIWTLILRYQINKGGQQGGDDGGGAKKELLDWVNKQIEPYGLKVSNFKQDFQNPKIISALTDSLRKGTIPIEKVSTINGSADERTADIAKAMDIADRAFGIPQLMDARDMAEAPDELGVMTYVSYFRDRAADNARKQAVDPKASYAKGPGLEKGPHNDTQPREFRIFAVDANGLPAAANDCDAAVQILDPTGRPLAVSVVPAADGNGSHVVTYKPTVPGLYHVDVKVNGESIKDMPKKVPIFKGASGEKINTCKFSFTIHARNEDGDLETEGGDLFQVEIANENGEAIDVKTRDNGDGTYSAEYHLTQGALYTASVRLNGQHMANSPFYHDMRVRADD